MAFRIVYSRDTERHLLALTSRQRATVLDAIRGSLCNEATVETRNRKRLRDNPLAAWELRVGALRVYYKVVVDPEPVVYILAIGIKDRDRVRIGGEEVSL